MAAATAPPLSLLAISDAVAAISARSRLAGVVCGLGAAALAVQCPESEWADEIVARGLMVGSSFFGAASALARSENLGVAFFVDMVPAGPRRVIDSFGALLVVIISGYVTFNAIKLGWITTGQTTGSGLPIELDLLSDGRRRAAHDGFSRSI